nr:Putative major facilitator transporter [Streptomyces sp. F8]
MAAALRRRTRLSCSCRGPRITGWLLRVTEIDTPGAATRTGDRSRPRAELSALRTTQITSW